MIRKNSYDEPLYRPLKVYAFDPSRGRTLGNHMTVDVPYEKLRGGLAGKYLEVIDYDAANACYYEPLDPDHPSVLMQGGLEPSESDPRFHQQMVYAVASRTISVFEFALGRKIKWAFNRDRPQNKKRPLRLYPHAMQAANAFYSRDLEALVFGYFPASDSDPVSNLPGQTIFTCLSHDIIAHETTHALIDGQRKFFMEATSPDTLAFHEAFADIVALFQHFSFKEVLLDVIRKTGGLIYRPEIAPGIEVAAGEESIAAELNTANPLVQLAKQFGEAMGQRAALRSALGTKPNSRDIENLFEPHDRGAILVAAVFDAFFTIYVNRVRDLLRIAGNGAKISPGTELHPDLAERLAAEASKTAEHFLNISIRALDYCPPVDIRFGDFLRAMITADFDLVADDPLGYRAALIDAFRLRGIRPDDVFSYAEESLRWCPPEDLNNRKLRCEGLQFDLFREITSKQKTANARTLHKFAVDHRSELGFDDQTKISVHSFHPIHRVGPNGRLKMEAVAELIQKKDVAIDPADPSLGKMTYYGGVTLVIDLAPEKEGEIRYAIHKNLGADDAGNERLRLQRGFFRDSAARYSLNVYADKVDVNLPTKSAAGGSGLSFAMVHRGY
ncbi:MAG: peptidase M4 [Acidobacteria bacterium]|nr:peptidase M4 [Acidobacteriota bacterium]